MSDGVNLSLNEFESLAKRAARGAGYPWGLCEEAAKAARWLCAYGLDGVGQLASLLGKSLAGAAANHRPMGVKPVADQCQSGNTKLIWQANGPLCPVATGAYLSDSAHIVVGIDLEIRQLFSPALILPFAANVALATEQTISIVCHEMVAITDGTGVEINHRVPDGVSDVSVRCGGSMSTSLARQNRVLGSNDCLQVLQRYADLTYAPATEESRLAGAGAGLSDND